MSRTVTVSSPVIPEVTGMPAREFASWSGQESPSNLRRYDVTLRIPDNPAIASQSARTRCVHELANKSGARFANVYLAQRTDADQALF